jgi:diaminohydroxyphosphoribosylaminopyrimidine deaminase/5-amino-6-(5-phosphoribosylamino)uracil reductase
VQAVAQAGGAARGATAYLNLECGDCHGDAAAIRALAHSGVARVVLGLRHPLPHLRGRAVAALRAADVAVDILGEAPCAAGEADEAQAYLRCLQVRARAGPGAGEGRGGGEKGGEGA